jgi:hypothetical protein
MRGLIVTKTTTATSAKHGDALVANLVAGVLGVAAFSVSFTHVMHVASSHGQTGWVAEAIATSVELLALAAVAELRRRKAKGEPAWIAVLVLMLGVSMSLAANLATAAPGAWGKTMAAWPAVAFLAVAALVESRTSARTEPIHTDVEKPVNAPSVRQAPARTAGPVAPQSPARTEPARTEPARTEPARTEPARTEPVRTHDDQSSRTQDAARTEAVPAETGGVAAPQAESGPQTLDTVSSARVAVLAPAAKQVVPTAPTRTLLIGTNSPDTASDTATPATAGAVGTTGAWQPGRAGLLLPAAYAPAIDRNRPPVLLVPGHPVPAPRTAPRTEAVPARTDPTGPARTEHGRTGRSARTGATKRTSTVHTDPTQRPSRTDVVKELVAALRTNPAWRPDYEELTARTGYKRSFLEKSLREARETVTAR